MKNYLLILTILFLTIGSCSKKPEDAIPKETCRVLTSIDYHQNEHWQYTYDDKSRVVKLNNLSRDEVRTISYQADKITITGRYPATYKLDAAGRIVDSGINKFEYNSDGYLVKVTSVYGDTRTLTYENGNLVKVERTSTSSSVKDTQTFEYSSEPAINIAGLPVRAFGSRENLDPWLLTHFGKPNRNLVSKEINRFGNSSPFTDTYTYLKDEKGNIIYIRTVGNNYNSVKEIKLTYECK